MTKKEFQQYYGFTLEEMYLISTCLDVFNGTIVSIKKEESKRKDLGGNMSYKSRGNFQVSVCFKKCANRGTMCEDCIGGRLFKESGKKPLPNANKGYINTDGRNV